MFDERYKNEEFYWGQNPSRIINLILKYKQKGDVLDLGVGEGRNSLFLAKNGFNVTGIDISEVGLRKFKTISKKMI